MLGESLLARSWAGRACRRAVGRRVRRPGLRAEVFPVSRDSPYSYGDGKRTSRIVQANAGRHAKSLKVLDMTASRAVDFSVAPVTGAVGFPLARVTTTGWWAGGA